MKPNTVEIKRMIRDAIAPPVSHEDAIAALEDLKEYIEDDIEGLKEDIERLGE